MLDKFAACAGSGADAVHQCSAAVQRTIDALCATCPENSIRLSNANSLMEIGFAVAVVAGSSARFRRFLARLLDVKTLINLVRDSRRAVYFEPGTWSYQTLDRINEYLDSFDPGDHGDESPKLDFQVQVASFVLASVSAFGLVASALRPEQCIPNWYLALPFLPYFLIYLLHLISRLLMIALIQALRVRAYLRRFIDGGKEATRLETLKAKLEREEENGGEDTGE